MKYAREIAFSVVAVMIGAGLWMWLTGTSTVAGPSESEPMPNAADPAAAPDLAEVDPEAPADPAQAAAPRPAHDFPASIEVPAERIPRSVKPFSTAAEASDFVEGRVTALLSAVDPDLDVEHLERDCSPDGRVCTFYGPWPGDDFLKAWLIAISEQRTGIEALEGVRFSVFKPIEEGGERRLMLTAHAP
jgi:hypothetical protein